MIPVGELTLTGAEYVVRSARRTARRAALSAALWVLALIFVCLMLGFGAVGLFLLLAVTQGAVVAAFSVAAIAGVFAALFMLVAMNPAAGHEVDPHPQETDRTERPRSATDGPSPETTAMVMGVGFLSGLFSGRK